MHIYQISFTSICVALFLKRHSRFGSGSGDYDPSNPNHLPLDPERVRPRHQAARPCRAA